MNELETSGIEYSEVSMAEDKEVQHVQKIIVQVLRERGGKVELDTLRAEVARRLGEEILSRES